MRQFLPVLILCILALSCKKEQPTKAKHFYMSVKVDGVFKETTVGYAVVEIQKNNYLTLVAQISPTETISLAVNNLTSDNYFAPEIYGIGFDDATAIWGTYTGFTLNITELSSTSIKGTFQFKAGSKTSNLDKVFTEGTFDADVLYSQNSVY